jgi:hypothetical protein
MFEIEYAVFADKAIVEAQTGKVSLIGIFQAVTSALQVLPALAFYCLAKADAGQFDLAVDIETEAEGKRTPIARLPLQVQVGSPGTAHFVLNINGLPVVGEKLIFSVYLNEDRIYEEVMPIIG